MKRIILLTILVFIANTLLFSQVDESDDRNFTFSNICIGDETEFTIDNLSGIDSVYWYFGDHASGDANSSTLITPTHIFAETGSFTVELIIFIGGEYIFVTNVVNIYSIPTGDFVVDPQICFGEEVGIVSTEADLVGADFSWDFGAGEIVNGSGSGPYDIIWLSSGNNEVSLMVSNHGCIGESQSIVSIPEAINLTVSSNGVKCYGGFDGTIDLSVEGGIGTLSFLWSPNGKISEDLSQLISGNYMVTVTDANNCSATKEVFVSQPAAPLDVVASVTGVCTENELGNIYLQPLGGTPQYSYAWDNNNTYSQNQVNVPAGVYTVTLTDYNSCSFVRSINLEPPLIPLEIVSSKIDASCFGYSDGTIDLEVNGGTGAYSYYWDYENMTSQDITGLVPGIYNVIVTDDRLCMKTESFIIEEPLEIIIDLIGNNYICYGQETTLEVNVSEYNNDYVFIWNDNSEGRIKDVSPIESTWYSVYAQDESGCTSTVETINIGVSPKISANYFLAYDVICSGYTNILSVELSGGDGGPYQTYLPNGSLVEFPYVIQTDETELLTLTTIDGCGTTPQVEEVAVATYDAYILDIQTDVIKGCAPLEVSFNEGGNGIHYSWNFNDDAIIDVSDKSNPSWIFEDAGKYTVSLSVVDENGCETHEELTDMIEVFETQRAVIVVDSKNYNILNSTISFSSDTDVYFNTWYFGDGSTAVLPEIDHKYDKVGIYSVSLVVETVHGCRDTESIDITIRDETTFYVPTAFTPNNDGNNDEFTIFANNISEDGYLLAIYDRWGNNVFESRNIDQSWDGRNRSGKYMETGVYTWIVVYKDKMDVENNIQGTITIIR